MKRSKVKKNILTKGVKSSKDFKNCYLCNTINLMHEHYDISPLLATVSQWDTKGSSKIRSIQHFKCLVCNYNCKDFKKWKTHIMSNKHMSMCHILNKVCSYFCKACKTLFYGSEMIISQHHKDMHGSKCKLSGVSILMSELMNCLNSHSKHIYFCNLCRTASETPVHTSGKHLNKQKLYECKYCNVTFLCNTDELDFHEASVEHLTFKCIYSIKKTTEVNCLDIQKQDQVTKTTYDFQTKLKPLELPLIIMDRFQKTSKSMAKCNLCSVLVPWSTQSIVKHVHECLNKGKLTSEMHKMLITAYDCKVCNFKTNYFFSYKLHVISPIHLKSSHASGDFYSYFCTVCNLYIYASKIQINNHLKRKHKTNLTDLPFLSKVLKDNYKYISNHPGSDFIDYYNDQQSYEKDFFPVQCNACKISFCMSNYEYNLHEISSEHVILKYFTPTNPSLVMKHNYGYDNLQTTSTTNADFIINNEALINKCVSSIKTDNSHLEEISVNKDYASTKKRKLSMNNTIVENNKLFQNCNGDKSHSAISSFDTNHNIQKNVYVIDDDNDGNKITDFNSNAEILYTEHAQGASNYGDVSTSSYDLNQKNIIHSKLEKRAICEELFSEENTKDADYTKRRKNIQSTKIQSNITTLYNQLHPTDIDQAYGQYVTERLKNIHDASLKSNIKTKIDALFCTYT